MALLGLKVKGQFMWWSQVRRHISQQEAEYALLKQASEEEMERLKASHKESLDKHRHELNKELLEVGKLRSEVEVLRREAAEADKKLQEKEVIIRNLADENQEQRDKIRNLRNQNSSLSTANNKMKKQLDALPQRGEGGRFVSKSGKNKKKTSDPEQNIKPVEVEQTPAKNK